MGGGFGGPTRKLFRGANANDDRFSLITRKLFLGAEGELM